MLTNIEDARRQLFVQLAGGLDGELSARFLKGDYEVPTTIARWLDGRLRIFVSDALVRDAEDRLSLRDDSRPNLRAGMERWLVEQPETFPAQRDGAEMGFWMSATAAANIYKWLFSSQDYSAGGAAKRKSATSINGWTEWAFGNTSQEADFQLLVASSDLERVGAWLSDPDGPPPLPTGAHAEVVATQETLDFALLPGQRARLLALIDEMDLPSVQQVQRWRSAFQERFPLERLERLQGMELLQELHGRVDGGSLVWWLESKQDDQFDAGFFGSIRGRNFLKHGLHQSPEDGGWRTGTMSNVVSLSEAEAVAYATRQRDQLLAAARVVQDLQFKPLVRGYFSLQQDVERVAPEFHQVAFIHKALALYYPDALDDYQVGSWQDHMLASMGVEPPAPEQRKLYAGARYFVAALQELREELGDDVPMGYLTGALNRLHGQPVKHWRIGMGKAGGQWPQMREREMVAVGWEELGDLADIVGGYSSREGVEALKEAIGAQWPDKAKSQVGKDARQLWDFYNTIKEGDIIYAASHQTIRGIGVVAGPYHYEDDDFPYAFRRRVKWLTTEPFRTSATKGQGTTVYNVSRMFDLITESVRHLDRPADAPSPKKKPSRIAKALAPVADQLARKGQVILYGPPGTGKTYHALQVAEELVARSSHVQGWADLSAEQRAAIKGARSADAQRIWTCTFHPAYGYEDFVEGLRARPVPGGLEFVPQPGLFKRICTLAESHRSEAFVLIIDEFNRGDSPRIFGELLTLLELDKRERLSVQLPLSGERFTVPRNVRILATMNTADRSISLLDAALRRRFGFVEYMPSAGPLADATVQGLHLGELLRVVNERLLSVLGNAARNLQVGHAYFMSEAQPIASVVALRNAIRYDLLPLLQEYCAEDPDALHTLLGDAFYDRERQRFRDALMETGREADFIDALVSWDRSRLAVEDDLDAGEAGLDDEDAEELDD